VDGGRGRRAQKEGGWEPLEKMVSRGRETQRVIESRHRRMLQCVVGVPSAVRVFLSLDIQFQANASNQLLSFRLENRMDRTAFRILFFS
jgi:hypothetical protein